MKKDLKLFNLTFRGLTKERLFEDTGKLKIVITVNSEIIVFANENKKFKNLINSNYATIDGQIPFMIAKLKERSIPFEKISGSDFVYDICVYGAKNKKRIFLLGGMEASNAKAKEILFGRFGVEIDGFSPPYQPYPFKNSLNREILKKIGAFKPHFLLVGFGPPKQEYWIDDNKKFLEAQGVMLAIGVGGTFELVSGMETRAPKLLSRFGLEGLWRLSQNPARYKRFIRCFKVFKYV